MNKTNFSKEQFECNSKKLQDLINERNDFFFYFSPDFDSVCSSLSFAIYLKRLKKNSLIYFPLEENAGFDFLFKIADYNKISIISDLADLKNELSNKEYVFTVFDTPNKALLPSFEEINSIFNSYDCHDSIEIDHHFGNDSEQIYSSSISLFKCANSCCDIIADFFLLCGGENVWDEYFPRNIVLILLTGICSDTQLGKFCSVVGDNDWFRILSQRLEELTWSDSGNFKTPHEIFDFITNKSEAKTIVIEKVMKEVKIRNGLGLLIFPKVDKDENLLDGEKFCSLEDVSDDLVNLLPQKSGKVGIFIFFDSKKEKYMIKIRRSTFFQDLDLRSLDVLIMDLFADDFCGGGGHPGAVSFRISDKIKYDDFLVKIDELFSIISNKYFVD